MIDMNKGLIEECFIIYNLDPVKIMFYNLDSVKIRRLKCEWRVLIKCEQAKMQFPDIYDHVCLRKSVRGAYVHNKRGRMGYSKKNFPVRDIYTC